MKDISGTGHRYELANLDPNEGITHSILHFVQKEATR